MKSKNITTYFWKNFRSFLPAIVWMVVIFFFSSRPRVVFSEDDLVNFLFFKSLHVIEYTVLSILYYLGVVKFEFDFKINKIIKNFKKIKFNFQSFELASFLTILYALSDEYHQTFVPGRFGTIRDVAIDSIGILICYFILKKISLKETNLRI